jgi:hypothetical protein
MLVVLKGSRTRFLKPPKNKTTTGLTGVSRTIKYDRRKDKSYLCYTVFWVGFSRHINNDEKVNVIFKIYKYLQIFFQFHCIFIKLCYEIYIDSDYLVFTSKYKIFFPDL